MLQLTSVNSRAQASLCVLVALWQLLLLLLLYCGRFTIRNCLMHSGGHRTQTNNAHDLRRTDQEQSRLLTTQVRFAAVKFLTFSRLRCRHNARNPIAHRQRRRGDRASLARDVAATMANLGAGRHTPSMRLTRSNSLVFKS